MGPELTHVDTLKASLFLLVLNYWDDERLVTSVGKVSCGCRSWINNTQKQENRVETKSLCCLGTQKLLLLHSQY